MFRAILAVFFILMVFMFGYYTGKRKSESKDKIENQ